MIYTDQCTDLRNRFANASSEFISCSINYSRPIKFCENCVQQYIYLLESYSNMSKFPANDTPCLNHFINLDRLGIVETLFENSKNLWSRAKCYECFVTSNGVPSTNVSDETLKFNGYYNNFNNCITTNSSNICSKCMEYYTDLQSYYVSISNENEKIGVCMDIVDVMNDTWIYWGDKCCKFRKHNEYIFICSTVMVFIVTVSYYILIKLYTTKNSPTIIQQSRFAKVLNSLST